MDLAIQYYNKKCQLYILKLLLLLSLDEIVGHKIYIKRNIYPLLMYRGYYAHHTPPLVHFAKIYIIHIRFYEKSTFANPHKPLFNKQFKKNIIPKCFSLVYSGFIFLCVVAFEKYFIDSFKKSACHNLLQ